MTKISLPSGTSAELLSSRAGLVWRVLAKAIQDESWDNWGSILVLELEKGVQPAGDAVIKAGSKSAQLDELLEGRQPDPALIAKASDEFVRGLSLYLSQLATEQRTKLARPIVNALHLVQQNTPLKPYASLDVLSSAEQTLLWSAVRDEIVKQDRSGRALEHWVTYLAYMPENLRLLWVKNLDKLGLGIITRNLLESQLGESRDDSHRRLRARYPSRAATTPKKAQVKSKSAKSDGAGPQEVTESMMLEAIDLSGIQPSGRSEAQEITESMVIEAIKVPGLDAASGEKPARPPAIPKKPGPPPPPPSDSDQD